MQYGALATLYTVLLIMAITGQDGEYLPMDNLPGLFLMTLLLSTINVLVYYDVALGKTLPLGPIDPIKLIRSKAMFRVCSCVCGDDN